MAELYTAKRSHNSSSPPISSNRSSEIRKRSDHMEAAFPDKAARIAVPLASEVKTLNVFRRAPSGGDHLSVSEVQRRPRNQLTVQFLFLDGLVYGGDRLLHFNEVDTPILGVTAIIWLGQCLS
jgi:hypothetical protein